MAKTEGYFCNQCGKRHEEMLMDVGFDAPWHYQTVPEAEREKRCMKNDDLCVIDETDFFIRGCLQIAVQDGSGPFVWGVWASLSEKNFQRAFELWDTEGREKEPPYFAWFCSQLPLELYPDTLNLKSNVITRDINLRPLIELEQSGHPLALEQKHGITMKRVEEIVEFVLHGQKKADHKN